MIDNDPVGGTPPPLPPPLPFAVETDAPPNHAGRRWVLTNRRNLIEFISGSVVRPVEAIEKYYPDPLQLTPGEVPILTVPVPDDLVSLSMSVDPEMNFPVLIELPGDMPERVPALLLPSPPVIHFRSEHEKGEVLARTYENADLADANSRVSPELFSGGEAVELGAAPESGKTLGTDQYDRLDRFLGAVSLLAVTADAAGMDLIVEILGAGESTGREWLTELRAWLLDAPGSPSGEAGLFRSALEVLGTGRAPIGGTEALTAIREKAGIPGSGGGETGDEIGSQLDRALAILSNEEAAPPFKDGGSPVPQAILYALQNSTKPGGLSAHAVERNAKGDLLAGAAVLCGVLHGRRRLPLDERDAGFDLFLAGLETELIAGHLQEPTPTLSVKSRSSGLVSTRTLVAGKTTVLSVTQCPTIAEVIRLGHRGIPALVDFCRKSGLDHLVTTVIELGSDRAFTFDGSTLRVPGSIGVTHEVVEDRLLEEAGSRRLPENIARSKH